MAGTPIRTPHGSRRIETTFVRVCPVLELHVGGEVIRTTAEHPFFVLGRGWAPIDEIQPGDELLTLSGQPVQVTAVRALDKFETVYNFRVEGDHTYFVGDDLWTFALWAHNAKAYVDRAAGNHPGTIRADGKYKYLDPETNTWKWADRSELHGDHVLSKRAFQAAIKDKQTALGRQLTPAERAQVDALMNSAENLRTMPKSFNMSKGARTGKEWEAVGSALSKSVDPRYMAGIKVTQAAVGRQLRTLLATFT